jgi:UDPglucose 6-dehydrogenase
MISKRPLAVAFAVALLAVSRRIIAACGGEVRCKTIGILGLTFKPNTDDMRDAPAISIIQTLIDAGAKVKSYDPEAMLAAREIITAIEYMDSTYDVQVR